MAENVDALVIGAGPAGLTAAWALKNLGIENVLVAEREAVAGGIPRHSHHPGYGIRDLHRFMNGPSYAKTLVTRAKDAGVRIANNFSVTDWEQDGLITATSKNGRQLLMPQVVILATGARERPRPARLVAGNRVRGIYTTGELQQAVYERKLPIGTRAVVVGAEHVSFSALMTLNHADVKVVAMVTEHHKHQSYPAFYFGAKVRYQVPLRTTTSVVSVNGTDRVESVTLRDNGGNESHVECDVVVFTGNWIADYELAQRSGITRDSGTTGPLVNQLLRTSQPNVFAAGNILHPVTTADVAALDGVIAARSAAEYLTGRSLLGNTVSINVAPPFTWVSPQQVLVGAGMPPRNCFQLWVTEFPSSSLVVVQQGTQTLFSQRLRLVPGRPAELKSDWISSVDPAGGPIQIRLG